MLKNSMGHFFTGHTDQLLAAGIAQTVRRVIIVQHIYTLTSHVSGG